MLPETQTAYKLIGSLLLLGEAERKRILSGVGEDFFTDESAKAIFRNLSVLCRKYPDADESVLLFGLPEHQRKNAVAMMSGMISPTIAKSSLNDTLRAARELSASKKLSGELMNLATSPMVSIGDIRRLSDLAEKLNEAANISSRDEYLQHFDDKLRMIPTGFQMLDDLLGGGFAEGTLSTVGARPSTGKTTFAINIVSHLPEKKTLFFSLEMTARMIFDRLISDIANVDYRLAFHHHVPIETARAVLDRYEHLDVIDNLSDVESIAEMIYAQKPALAVVDFMQIITSDRRFADNRQRIDYISQTLKQAAKSTGCCVLTLSQLTRAGKDKPTMSDLKESGGLEQDSDYVILLHRPFVNDKSNESIKPKDTTVILDKNKFGGTKELTFDFDGIHQRFTETHNEDVARPAPIDHNAVDEDLPF